MASYLLLFIVYSVYLLYLLHGSSHTVKAFRYGLPFTGEFDHASSIQHTITKQMIELKAHTIPSPLVNLIVQFVPLRSEYSQVLQVSPSQVWTTHKNVKYRSILKWMTVSIITVVIYWKVQALFKSPKPNSRCSNLKYICSVESVIS